VGGLGAPEGRDGRRAGGAAAGAPPQGDLKTLAIDPSTPTAADLAVAARVLREGGLVAFPTETFYGLGANALDADAVARVFRAKGRPADKPLLVLVDSLTMARAIVADIPARAADLIERYWPGPLTLVLRAQPHVPSGLTAGTGTIGVRMPGHPVARALVRAAALPVTAPSANAHGGASPRTAEEVRRGLGASVELVLDGGETPGGRPSTVIDATGEPLRVIRAGAIALDPAELGER
jgi:L-threonylcarbamoyladenylate synthase